VSGVLVLTNELDLAADDVIRRLADRGVAVRRLNIEDVTAGPAPRWALDEPASRPGAVWWRQFELPVVPGHRMSVDDVDDLLVQRAQWRAWLATLDSPGVIWVNDLWAARRAENKVVELQTAVDVGFDVPSTTITNDRNVAAQFLAGRPGVLKSLAAAYFEISDAGFVYTHDSAAVLEHADALWFAQPVVVQERKVGADVRVIYVDGEVFGASCDSPILDWRTAIPSPPWHRWSPSGEIWKQCEAYCNALGLHYAAFDFIDDGSTCWFLEANQAGEWSFIERQLDLGVTDAVVRLLARLGQ
jgi:glutathione synthase/RimK-type ligase-like ATP-grasp enzyme